MLKNTEALICFIIIIIFPPIFRSFLERLVCVETDGQADMDRLV